MTSERQMVRLRRLHGKEFMSLKSCSCIAFEKSRVRYFRFWHLPTQTLRLKGMSDERQNRPILSADKIARQNSVVCHAKIARFCRPTKSPDFVSQDRACSIFDDFVGRIFVYQTTNFVYVSMVIVYNGRWIFILVIYCVCYLFSFIRCRKKWCKYYFATCSIRVLC